MVAFGRRGVNACRLFPVGKKATKKRGGARSSRAIEAVRRLTRDKRIILMASQQSRIQAYLEKYKIGPLFEEMMTKLITETPDQPIPFLISHLQNKQGRSSQLQRTLSGSAALWAETENKGARRDCRGYDKPWLTNAKKPKKSKSDLAVSNISPPSPETKSLPRSIEHAAWDWRTKPESHNFDELNHILQESKKLGKALENLSRSIGTPDEFDQDLRGYNSSLVRPKVVGEWVGREETDADPLAAEMLQPPVPRIKDENEEGHSPGSTKLEQKSKGLRQQQQQHKKLLAAMLSQDSFDSVHSNAPSVAEEDIEDEDDAMELLEDLDDLRMEGITDHVPSGSKFSQGRSLYSAEPQAKVTLNICSRFQGDSLMEESDDGTQMSHSPEQAVPEPQAVSPLLGVERVMQDKEEFENASQVSGPKEEDVMTSDRGNSWPVNGFSGTPKSALDASVSSMKSLTNVGSQGVWYDTAIAFEDYAILCCEFVRNFEKDEPKTLARSISLAFGCKFVVKVPEHRRICNMLFDSFKCFVLFFSPFLDRFFMTEDIANITKFAIHRCIREVTEPLYARKRDNYLLSEQREAAGAHMWFCLDRWLPMLQGTRDCTHVSLRAAHTNPEMFCKCKGYHSLNLQLLCDHTQHIMKVNTQYPGSSNDDFILCQVNIVGLSCLSDHFFIIRTGFMDLCRLFINTHQPFWESYVLSSQTGGSLNLKQPKDFLVSMELLAVEKHLIELDKNLATKILTIESETQRSSNIQSRINMSNYHGSLSQTLLGQNSRPRTPSSLIGKEIPLQIQGSKLPQSSSNETSRPDTPSSQYNRLRTSSAQGSRPTTPNTQIVRTAISNNPGNKEEIFSNPKNRLVTPTSQVGRPLSSPANQAGVHAENLSQRSHLSELLVTRQPWTLPSDTDSEGVDLGQDKCSGEGLQPNDESRNYYC
uniref:uncharacterized protein C8orf34 homolog n=1 Tax=Pristiophorus japonicus TaxID=55135 RepID=UPI00398EB507